MILANTDIKNYVAEGKIKISDFSEQHLSPASYDFSLGSRLLLPLAAEFIDIEDEILPEYAELVIRDDGYKLGVGEFVLGQTQEILSLSNDVAMVIEGRSRYARAGIEVTQTSTFAEPDHRQSIITMEIKNNGNSPVVLHKGARMFKGIFHKLLSPYDEGLGRKSTYSTSSDRQTAPEPPRNG